MVPCTTPRAHSGHLYSSGVRIDNIPNVYFSISLGQEPKVEVGLV
jgi:hypothetical protein